MEYKFDEDVLLRELKDYVDSTYDQHYASKGRIQVTEFISSQLETGDFFRGNVLKYTSRYGYKDSHNRKDILKAMHYLLMLYLFMIGSLVIQERNKLAVSLVRVNCAKCACLFAVPQELHDAALHSDKIIFFCPYGHELHFGAKESIPLIEQKDKENKEEKEKRELPDNVFNLEDFRKHEQ